MKRKILTFFIVLIVFVLNSVVVYSGWADLDDETADAQANKMLEQQEKELHENITYLEELSKTLEQSIKDLKNIFWENWSG